MFLGQMLLLLCLSLPSMVWADHLPDYVEAGTSVNDIPLPLTDKTAAELALVENGGKVLSVRSERYENHDIFRVKMLHDDGKVKTYRIDRETGYTMP